MKRILALLTALMLIAGTATLALAEETAETTDATSSATTQSGRGGRNSRNPGNGNIPQVPGQNNGQSGQVPQMPGQSNGQQPQMPGQNRNGQAFGKSGRKSDRSGSLAVKTDKLETWLAQLVKDGVITQEISDAILAYVKAQAAQQTAQTDTDTPAESTAPPELPDSTASAESPEARLLKEMLENGIITQEQYDEFLNRVTAPETAGT